jgi:hypothetical protein
MSEMDSLPCQQYDVICLDQPAKLPPHQIYIPIPAPALTLPDQSSARSVPDFDFRCTTTSQRRKGDIFNIILHSFIVVLYPALERCCFCLFLNLATFCLSGDTKPTPTIDFANKQRLVDIKVSTTVNEAPSTSTFLYVRSCSVRQFGSFSAAVAVEIQSILRFVPPIVTLR